MTDDVEARLQAFLDALATGDLDVLPAFLASDFFTYSPGPDEPTAAERRRVKRGRPLSSAKAVARTAQSTNVKRWPGRLTVAGPDRTHRVVVVQVDDSTGHGRMQGEALEVGVVDGEERIYYSGFELRRIE